MRLPFGSGDSILGRRRIEQYPRFGAQIASRPTRFPLSSYVTGQPDRSLDLAAARLSAATEAGDPASAAIALGRERGSDGVGLGQALDDLEVVHRVVTSADPSAAIVRTFADAWAEAAVTVLLGRGAIDHRTGLATIEFLATRLRDLARTREHGERRLILVHCTEQPRGRLGALLRSTRIASELARAFPGAETPVGLTHWRIVAIVPTIEVLDANLVHARRAIGRIPDVELNGVEVLELPSGENAVRDFVRQL